MPSRIRTGGRPTKLTPAIQQAITNAVGVGVPLTQAALLVGVGASTVQEWVQRGEGRDTRRATPLYAGFAEAVKKAESADEVRRLLQLNAAAQGGGIVTTTTHHPDGTVTVETRTLPPVWQCNAWFLERKWPERYGRRLHADLTLQIQRAAQEVADEIGIDVALVLREAQSYLQEKPRGGGA